MTGTLVNTATVIAGGTLGSLLGAGLPPRMKETVITGMSLVVVVLGVKMALATQNILIVLGSVALGGIIGEALGIQKRLDSLGDTLERRAASSPFLSRGRFSQGFVTASLVFCVGPMTVLGSIQDGLAGDSSLLLVKSMLDGFAALAFASVFGMGVTASALVVLAVQGSLTLGASFFSGILTEAMVTEMSAAGGVIMLGISVHMMELRSIRLANYLPALVLAPVAVWAIGFFQ
ncbi:MAG TPA: DUF554 domain-containing protein [Candidatus Sabulitectum sp.]|nr:DUF554 domain-containing protein [Candidatus Sabulitectum sp.]HPF31686.1 DUF554 domain-containing protein [Candidatus Sabulitectum sp.]HPJ28562.1 DUF554 domain-containing protein [Candidatus Sabulitectum sp.]HPR22933.1 DUF554 domain-containing protein [Candidatus Sabulitectum sp.]HRW77575.1 DUF554 domain-containing protein [Candidatus Sabulitectum sp.]